VRLRRIVCATLVAIAVWSSGMAHAQSYDIDADVPHSAGASRQASETAPDAPVDPYDPRYTWGDTNSATAPAFVAAEKAFADRVANELGLALNLVETDHFLFHTDLPPREAHEWQRVLDLMYERVNWLLGVPEGVNLFRGKATVFLFADQAKFVEFERRFYNHRVTYEAGICHQHPTGEVRIAFYRIDHTRAMRQLMVHEAAHGVIHRFRSPARIPDWLNEGIAEWTAYAVLNFPHPFKQREVISQRAIIDRGGRLGDAFWQDGRFSAADYGAAFGLVKILLRKGKPAFHDLVDRLKDGQTYDKAIEAVYGYDIPHLVSLYGRSINVPNLKP